MKKLPFSLPEDAPQQARNAVRIVLALLVLLLPTTFTYIYLAINISAWQLVVAVGISVAYIAAFLVTLRQTLKGKLEQAGQILVYSLVAGLVFFDLVIADFGLLLAIAALLLTSGIGGQVLPARLVQRATILAVLGGVFMVIFDQINLGYRLRIPQLQLYIPIVLVIFLIILGIMVRQQFRDYSLRTKLMVSILGTTALSLTIFVGYSAYMSAQTQNFVVGQLEESVLSQARQQLNSLAQSEAAQAESLFEDIAEEAIDLADYQQELSSESAVLMQGAYWDGETRLSLRANGLYTNSTSDPASVVVHPAAKLDEETLAEINTSMYLDFTAPAILKSNPDVAAVYFISAKGYTIYYPNIDLGGLLEPGFDPRTESFYTIANPQNNPSREAVWTEPYQDPAGQGLLVTSSVPVYDQDEKFRGVVAIDLRLEKITQSISEIQAGQTGFAFLIDSAGNLLGMPEAGYQLFGIAPEGVAVGSSTRQNLLSVGGPEFQATVTSMMSGETGLEAVNIQGKNFLISYAPLPDAGYSLGIMAPTIEVESLYLTTRDQVEDQTQATSRLGTLILATVLFVAVGISFLLSQFLINPIARLTFVANQVTAGNIDAQAQQESTDEIGVLANAFNTMTSRLRTMLQGLEERVQDRTRNLELAAEVGRSVSQMRAIDIMLKEAVELIRSNFDLYYVQVYLANQSQGVLQLEAGTGPVGAELLSRRHSLPLSAESINGRAAIEKHSVVITDTATNLTFRPNPLLPETRSEMAVPLIVSGNVVGVLDLQSRVGGSLSQDDLAAFEALAGQLAIAIQNANLLAEAEQARFEVEAQARKLVRAGWQEYLDGVHQPENLGFVFVGDQVIPQEKTTVVEGTNEKDVLTAPISISSENLGALTVEMAERKRSAQAEQLTFAVARQVAQHIENLRLLESAERYRAQAEQASRRIIREGWQEYATSNVEKMLSYDYDLNEVRTSAPDKQQPEESGIALPLKVREEPVGKIVIHDLVSEDHDALALAQTIAERLSTHIENLRLFEQTRDRAQREQALRQITNAVRGSTDPATILRSAARELGTLLRRKTVIRMATSNPGSASSPLAGQAVNDTKDDVTAAQASQDTAGGVE